MITSRFAKYAVAVGAIGLAAGLPSNVQAAGVLTNATATVATAITIVKNNDVEFGSVAVGAGGGDVVLATDGSRTTTGDASVLTSGLGAAGDFTVSGLAAATYSISLPADGTVILTDGANTMSTNTFLSLPLTTGLLDGTGNQTLLVGATLVVGGAQVPNLYTTTFTMTVDYN